MTTELGTFLRVRRAQVTPDSPAYQPSGRRRIPGLRREEVAAAAGISVDYYTRLEQGREVNPSDAVLKTLAGVLELDADAIDHMYRLRAVATAPAPIALKRPRELDDRMATLVEAVRPNPAYVLDRLSNVVAINPEALRLFEGLDDLPVGQRNTCHYFFTHPRAGEVFVDWQSIAWASVAQLRAANAEHLADDELKSMVRELEATSKPFRQWWNDHDVAKRRFSAKRVVKLDGATYAYQYEVLHLPDEGLRLSLYIETDVAKATSGGGREVL